MKNKTYLLIILFSFLSLDESYAKFDSLIVKLSGFNLHFQGNDLYPVGDFNNDGFDDLLIYDCSENALRLYYGGNPMDSIPAYIWHPRNIKLSILSIDLNDDSVKDIIVNEYDDSSSILEVFYGGAKADTIADIKFRSPDGTHFLDLYKIKDFNGDGRSELVFYDPFYPNQHIYHPGLFYFYNTGSQFDTIPHFVIIGDSIERINPNSFSSGDINGDGFTDFTFSGSIDSGHVYWPTVYFREWYLGNVEGIISSSLKWYSTEHIFDIEQLKIVNDLNNDGKDDIIIRNYNDFYPYYFGNAVLYGNYPIDTIPDIGLNTQNWSIDIFQRIDEAGDLNGDGYNDLFCKMTAGGGYPGVSIWLGQRVMPKLPVKRRIGGENGLCRMSCVAGDVNGDGVNDVAIAAIVYGGNDPFCNSANIFIYAGDTSAVTDIKQELKQITPSAFKLYKPYPNPFNPEITIKWIQPIKQNVTIELFDILGKKIKEIYNTETEAGEHEIVFNAENNKLSSGIYFIKVKSGENSVTEKIVFTK